MKAKIKGWLGRDKSGYLRLWRTKPYKEVNFDYGASWGLPCEMGAWIRLDKNLFPNVKWEDEEPTEVVIKVKMKRYGRRKII